MASPSSRLNLFLAPMVATAAVSLSVLGYGILSPRSQLLGRQVWRLAGQGLCCALTFDDGPQEPYTSSLLDLLAAEGVAATFFVLGRQAECHPQLIERMRREGHEVGIHGYEHRMWPGLSSRELAFDLDRSLDVLGGARLVRPPYGWKDWRLFRLAAERNLTVVGWSAHGADWRGGTAEAIAGRLVRRTRPGAIILLHDGCGEDNLADRSRSVAATGLYIRELRRRGYDFTRL